ncbi:hypothetical protein [Oceaniglobus ichthyenteri]|uniref:hypothetical protein n=1 Tax=Oceaniglobus ichthyenteri TaxID=2136177 RepID=UPI000F81859F|nr:hypothetical protein [Oceaniglobus ichthyenteri]
MSRLAHASAPSQDLPSLIYRAASMLSGAKIAAEVLEAREVAGLAYDAARARGDVSTRQRNPGSVGHVGDHNMPPATAAVTADPPGRKSAFQPSIPQHQGHR